MNNEEAEEVARNMLDGGWLTDFDDLPSEVQAQLVSVAQAVAKAINEGVR